MNQEAISFLERFGYKVSESSDKVLIVNTRYTPTIVYVFMMIIGIIGIALGIMSAFKILLLCVLLVFIPIHKILNQTPERIIINYSDKMINSTAFYDVKELRYDTSEQKTTASPFRNGTTEYVLTLEIVKKDSQTIELAKFINRKKEKPGSEELLESINKIFINQ